MTHTVQVWSGRSYLDPIQTPETGTEPDTYMKMQLDLWPQNQTRQFEGQPALLDSIWKGKIKGSDIRIWAPGLMLSLPYKQVYWVMREREKGLLNSDRGVGQPFLHIPTEDESISVLGQQGKVGSPRTQNQIHWLR